MNDNYIYDIAHLNIHLHTLDGVLDLLQLVVVLPVPVLPQFIVLLSQLLEEPKVGLHLPGVPHVLQGLGGAVSLP